VAAAESALEKRWHRDELRSEEEAFRWGAALFKSLLN